MSKINYDCIDWKVLLKMDLNEKLIHFGSHYIYNSEAIYTYLGHNQAIKVYPRKLLSLQ